MVPSFCKSWIQPCIPNNKYVGTDTDTHTLYTRAFQPAGRGPHAAREAVLCGPRSQMLSIYLLNEWNNETRIYYITIFGSINPLFFLIWWSLIGKILQKIYKTPLILLHAARLMTRLTGVRPAVDLSWKALLYTHPYL